VCCTGNKPAARKVSFQVSEGYEGNSLQFKISCVKQRFFFSINCFKFSEVGHVEKMCSFVKYVHTCKIVLSVYVYTHLSIYPTTPVKTTVIVYLILLLVAVIHDDKPTFASAEFRNKDYLHLYKMLRKMYVKLCLRCQGMNVTNFSHYL
jgi:hypothetical protein